MNNQVFSNQRKSASANSGTDQYYQKYLKYKQKYLSLVKKIGGGESPEQRAIRERQEAAAADKRNREEVAAAAKRNREEVAAAAKRKQDEVAAAAKLVAEEKAAEKAAAEKLVMDENRSSTESKRAEITTKLETLKIDNSICGKENRVLKAIGFTKSKAATIKDCSDKILQFNDCITKEIEFVKNYSNNFNVDQTNRGNIIDSMKLLMDSINISENDATITTERMKIITLYKSKVDYYNLLQRKSINDTSKYFLDHEEFCEKIYKQIKEIIEAPFK
jgi:hypothetical protein